MTTSSVPKFTQERGEKMNCTMLTQLIGEEQTGNLVSILSVFPKIPVHITGIQGPTGKSTLCKKLRENGINAFEGWELKDKEKDNSNALYIEIALNKPIKLAEVLDEVNK